MPIAKTVQHLRRRRVGEEADLVHRDHLVPRVERFRHLGGLVGGQRLVAHRVERHARRQHQALLRAANGDVDAPFVVAIVGGCERRNCVDHEQRRMTGGIDRLADFGDRGQRAGRGLVMQDADRLDLLGLVVAQPGFDRFWVGAVAPVAGDEFGLEADAISHFLPQRRELAGLDHQHLVARRQRVDERGFPGAGSGRGIDDDRVRGLENGLDAFEATFGEPGELRAAVIDDRRVHRAQNAIRERRGPRDMEKMATDGTRRILSHRKSAPERQLCGDLRGLATGASRPGGGACGVEL